MTTSFAPVPESSILPATGLPPSRLRNVDLAGPEGRLEALLNEGVAAAPYAALLCHPHPKGGGAMHNKVVYHAMKVFNDPAWGFGWPVLRFNFRGVGLSQGAHHGSDEAADVLAALEWLKEEFKLPIVVAGFSFGAAMSLMACCGQNELKCAPSALIALGLPTHAEGRDYHYRFLAQCQIPKLFLSGDHDQFAPPAQLTQVAQSASDPKTLLLIPGADHFFSDQLVEMQQSLSLWLKEQFK
jgi:alpha/beta superfamily hydrolase